MDALPNNLKSVLEHFEIQNKDMAKALNVDPAQISRWINGKRELKVASDVMESLAAYILTKVTTQKDIDWLKKAFARDGFDADFKTVSQMKRLLILWLASDGAEFKRNFWTQQAINKPEQALNVDYGEYQHSIGPAGRIYSNDYSVKAGMQDFSQRLEHMFSVLEKGKTADLSFSDSTIPLMTSEPIVRAINGAVRDRNIRVRCLLSVSGNSPMVSHLISTYLHQITSGSTEIALIYGNLRPVIEQVSVIVPEICVGIASELCDSNAPVAALFITEEAFVKDAQISFGRQWRNALPITTQNERNIRNASELFCQELSDSGNSDIITDTLNPMYLSEETLRACLIAVGVKGETLERRTSEWERMRAGVERNLQGGMAIRELISGERLKQIASGKRCVLPGLFFGEENIELDKNGCIDIINGYIDYLSRYPFFSVAITDAFSEDYSNSFWYIKQNCHAAVSRWDGEAPTFVDSEQMVLIYELQKHFEELWLKENSSFKPRENTIQELEHLLLILQQD